MRPFRDVVAGGVLVEQPLSVTSCSAPFNEGGEFTGGKVHPASAVQLVS